MSASHNEPLNRPAVYALAAIGLLAAAYAGHQVGQGGLQPPDWLGSDRPKPGEVITPAVHVGVDYAVLREDIYQLEAALLEAQHEREHYRSLFLESQGILDQSRAWAWLPSGPRGKKWMPITAAAHDAEPPVQAGITEGAIFRESDPHLVNPRPAITDPLAASADR